MVHLLMKPVEMGFYSTNLRHLLALRITIALIIGKRIVIKDQLKIILLLRQVVLIRYTFLVFGGFTCNFKCFALEHNASKAKHLKSVLRHDLGPDFVDLLQLLVLTFIFF